MVVAARPHLEEAPLTAPSGGPAETAPEPPRARRWRPDPWSLLAVPGLLVLLAFFGSALWFVIPLFLYWVCRLWLFAHRGHVQEDPIVFAIKDRASYVIGALVALTMLLATL